MINITFDGSYIVHKNVFTLIKANSLYGDFANALTINIKKFIDLIPSAQIHIVFDGKKSWRKQASVEYKANRIKDENIDWAWIYKELDIWIQSAIETTNWKIYTDDSIEGDDWIMALVKNNNKKGHNNIVIASDKDLLQLLKWNDKYINIQVRDIMSLEKVYLPEGYNIFLDNLNNNKEEDDVFDLSNSMYDIKTVLNHFIKNYDIEEINTNQFLFEKILKGDKGDNISSVYRKMSKNGTFRGIGDGGANKIWNIYSQLYGEKYNTSDDLLYDRMIECIELKDKKTLDDSIKESIKTNIKTNIKMMELNAKNYPVEILETMISALN